jgi:hypothetical protein
MSSIPLSFEKDGKLSLYLQLIGPMIPNSKVMKMILDTGASHTTLSLKDADEMGVDIESLRACPQVNIGYGGRMEVRELPHVVIVMQSVEKSTVNLIMDFIHINRTYSGAKEKDKNRAIWGIPSVMGVDILSKHGLELRIDWKSHTANLIQR